MSASRNLPSAIIDTFVAPAQAFAALRERPGWAWAALALIIVASAAAIYTMYAGMSPEWIVEQQLAQMGRELPPDQMAAARANMLQVAPYTAHIGAVATLIMTPVFAALFGLLYFVGERILSRERNSYGRWFAASSFSMLPMVVSSLGLIALVLVKGGGNLPIDLPNYASINNLFLGLAPDERGFSMFSSMNLFYLWTLVLIAVAGRVWSNMRWGKALLLGALPNLVVFLPWAAIVLAKG